MSEATDNQARGAEIKRRRLLYGISSVRKFATLAEQSREAITAAEGGTASAGTYERLEAFLDRYVSDGRPEEPNNDLVEFRLTGNFGVDVVVRGPVSDLAELESAVERLMSRMGNPGLK